MREIKFRAWDKKASRLVYAQLHGRYQNPFEAFGEQFNPDVRTSLEWEQFTGLKDKNGADIYEGDIVLTKWSEDFVGRDDGTNRVVHWCKKLAAWGETSDSTTKCGEWCGYLKFHCFPKHTRVIGNIHENSELLSGVNLEV